MGLVQADKPVVLHSHVYVKRVYLVKLLWFILLICLICLLWDKFSYDKTVNYEDAKVKLGSEYMEPEEFNEWLDKHDL